MLNLAVLGGTATVHGPLLSAQRFDAQIGLDVPCKNVDLQTGNRWACSSGFYSASPDSGYRAVSFEDDKAFMKALQKAIAPGIPRPAFNSNGKSGWFFAIPDNESKQMINTKSQPVGTVINGSVINLNPCCFGEVYWVGGVVDQDYVIFAIWVPYSRWVTGPLPIVSHFRPAYDETKHPEYGRARKAAVEQGVPIIFGGLGKGDGIHQPFLDSAWYYLLGQISFVQQMLAARKMAILTLMIPPTSGGPDTFFNQFEQLVIEAVDKAVQKAVEIEAGKVVVDKESFILTANSFGGTYLTRAARNMKDGQLREMWMFDCTNMQEGWNVNASVKRMYIAQRGNRGSLFNGSGNPWDREGADWSIVDVSQVPNHNDSLHDLCGRLCFSHACSLSSSMTRLQSDPVIDATLSVSKCGEDQEFWKMR